MLKCVVLLAVIACVFGQWEELSPESIRLIEFNETHREYLPFSYVQNHITECGKTGQHGGFFDITDHPNAKPQTHFKKIKFPSDPTHQDLVDELIGKIVLDNIAKFNGMLTSRSTRYYTSPTGRDAANDILNTFKTYANGRNDITTSLFNHGWLQPSVIARIEGNGPNSDEVVIIGAHEDSISSGSRAPGSDDDASGVSVLLETYRILVESGFVPSRTLEFHTYAAEEVGLRGSLAIANHYAATFVNVASMLQLDMTMYPGTTGRIGIVNDFVDPDLTAFLRKLVTAYADIGFVNTNCGYGCSDHASWTRAGYSSCFPFESDFRQSNSRIHTVNDLIDILSVEHGAEFVKIALGYAVELSLAP